MALEPSMESASHEPIMPRHVAIIMDGNGRWATNKKLPRTAGHHAGTENIKRVLAEFQRNSVQYVTLYAFSTENWNRPESEISGLMALLKTVIKNQIEELHQSNVRIRHLGTLTRLPDDLKDSITSAVRTTQNNTGLTLCVAFDYGGRKEILDAIKNMMNEIHDPAEITEDLLQSYLYLPDIPNPDLIIRTAGEQRLSNFLIWQAAYSEYYQTSTYWPDFDEIEVKKALSEYLLRQRKFGAIISEERDIVE